MLINLVDKHPISVCISLGTNGRITCLWVNRRFILRLHTGHAQSRHLFWTGLSSALKPKQRGWKRVFHSQGRC